MTEPVVRRATASDVPAAAATLAAAFERFPWITWTVADTARLAELYAMLIDEVALEHGEVWVTEDLDAVAVWTRPEAARAFDRIAPRLVPLLLPRGVEAQEVAVEHAVPAKWSLDAVGVLPAHRGRGLGGAVLAPRLAQNDRDGEDATLQTTSRRNVGLYEHLGFRVVDDFDLPAGGPHCWVMRRP